VVRLAGGRGILRLTIISQQLSKALVQKQLGGVVAALPVNHR
jgi:hypothetical protein